MSDFALNAPGYTHADLVKHARAWLSNRMNCRFALCEVSSGTGECPDAIGWKYGHQSHLVEVKVSRSDFFADREKGFRKNPERGVGMFRWFMAPAGLLTVADVEPCAGWGLLAVKGRVVQVLRKAQQQAALNRDSEICILVQAVANAQLCAPMDLNQWFADESSAVGRMRKLRREINERQRQIDLERTCGHFSIVGARQFSHCETVVATGHSRCSAHGGRSRGEKRKQSIVLADYEKHAQAQGVSE